MESRSYPLIFVATPQLLLVLNSTGYSAQDVVRKSLVKITIGISSRLLNAKLFLN